MIEEKERNSNIELLRILTMGGVILLHYNASPGNILNDVEPHSLNYYLAILINQMCVCAVDIFVFISGYFSCKKGSASIRKPIELIIEVIIFQCFFSVGGKLINQEELSLGMFLSSLLPRNYYVTLYIALYLISPFMNLFISRLDNNQFRKFIVIIILLFSIEPTMVDVLEGAKGKTILGISTVGILGSQWGYTIITFVLIYFIAAYIRLYGAYWSKSLNKVVWMLSIALLVIWKIIELDVGIEGASEHYQNPFVILLAVSTFLIFKEINIQSKFINVLSKGCFTVFLLHTYLIRKLMVTDIVNENTLVFIFGLLMRILLIYFICDTVGILYSFIEKIIFDYIEKKTKFYSIKI